MRKIMLAFLLLMMLAFLLLWTQTIMADDSITLTFGRAEVVVKEFCLGGYSYVIATGQDKLRSEKQIALVQVFEPASLDGFTVLVPPQPKLCKKEDK